MSRRTPAEAASLFLKVIVPGWSPALRRSWPRHKPTARSDKDLDSLRGDPEFEKLLKD